MSISFDFYRIFCAAAEQKSITAAAKALYLSQPTVSKAIQSLEGELGVPLFVRSKSGVRLTPEGELLYSHASRACAHIHKAEEELRGRVSLREGSVRIGASEMTLQNYLLPYLEEFRRCYPGVRLKIVSCSTPGAVLSLRDGLIDFAIVISPVDEDGLAVQPLSTFQDIIIAGERYFCLRGKTLTLRELAELPDCPLICTDHGTTSRAYLETFFAEHQVLLQPDMELATTDLIVPMVARSLGIGFVPEQFARVPLQKGEIIRIELAEALPRRQICLVQNPGLPVSLAGKAFLQMLLKPEDPLPAEMVTSRRLSDVLEGRQS